VYENIYRDVHKTSIAMFINEVLNKAVKEQSHAEDLCEFLIESLVRLDQEPDTRNFHLVFLLQLARWLGFQPQSIDEITEGRKLEQETESALNELLRSDGSSPMGFNNNQRRALLELLVFFYARHIDGFGHLKSTSVLREILQ
jgi:DNA repair protein RecO (recombination protein O)